MSGAAGSVGIDAEPGNEVVHGAGNGINGDAYRVGPAQTRGGSGENDVVGIATGAEPAIGPGDINFSQLVNGGGRQTRTAQVAIFAAETLIGNEHTGGPAHAAISGAEGAHTEEAVVGHDHGPVGLNQRESTQTTSLIASVDSRRPGQAAVAGGAHEDEVAERGLIPFRVAIAVEGAGGSVVANDPVLVVGAAVVDEDGMAPMKAVGGTADRYSKSVVVQNRKAGDEPDAVLSVIGNGRIAGRRVSPALVHPGECGKKAVGPGGATIGGGGETNVSAAAGEHTRHLKRAHDSGAEGKGVGLNLGAMFAVKIEKIIGTQPDQRLRVSRDGGGKNGGQHQGSDESAGHESWGGNSYCHCVSSIGWFVEYGCCVSGG